MPIPDNPRLGASEATRASRRNEWWFDATIVPVIWAPAVYLTLRGGGVDVRDFSVASACALAAAAFALGFAPGRGGFAAPWAALVLLLFPLVQIVPLGPAAALASPEVRHLHAEIASLGVDPPSTISVDPLATFQSWVLIAGCVAIFVLASGSARRQPRTLAWAVAPLLVLGFFEFVLGLRQYLHGLLTSPLTGPHAAAAQGDFANRDHYAVLLEACLAVSIGLAIAALYRARTQGWLTGAGACSLGAAGLASACLLGIVLSGSRAGIAIGAVVSALGVAAAVVSGVPKIRTERAVLALTLAAVAILAFVRLMPAGAAGRFEAVWQQHGDPIRSAIWLDSLGVARSYFWTGSGLGAFGSVFRRTSPYAPRAHVDHAHCDYLELLVELGFPVAIFLACAAGTVIGTAFTPIRKAADPAERSLRAGCLLGAAAILLHAAVDFPLRIPALAAVLAALLGLAYGGGETVIRIARRPARSATATAILSAVFAAVSLGVGFGPTGPYDVHALFARAETALFRGDHNEAETLYRNALQANPFLAGVWLRRSEAARLQGDDAQSLAYLGLARRLEPFTLRTEWPFVQRLLAAGRLDEAIPALASLAGAAPELRRGIYASSLGAGIAAETIAKRIVPAEPPAAGEFLRFLIERGAWDQMVAVCRSLRGRSNYTPPAAILQLLLDRLFAADQTAVMIDLVDELGIYSGRDAALPYFVRPKEGVAARVELSGAASAVEIDFHSPGNIAYGHVYRYFPVRTSAQYVVVADLRSDTITGTEPVRVAVRGPKRTLAVSPGLHGTTPWRAARMPISTLPSERMIRVEVMRPRGAPRGEAITGRFFLRNLRVIGETTRRSHRRLPPACGES